MNDDDSDGRQIDQGHYFNPGFFLFRCFRIVVGRKRRYFSTTIDDHGVHAFEMGKKERK